MQMVEENIRANHEKHPLPVGRVVLVSAVVDKVSTLWEKASTHAMVTTLHTVSSVFTKALEDETVEGDGIIAERSSSTVLLAFRSAARALDFAMTLQALLITEDWPSELLALDEAMVFPAPPDAPVARGPRINFGVHCIHDASFEVAKDGSLFYTGQGPIVCCDNHYEFFFFLLKPLL